MGSLLLNLLTTENNTDLSHSRVLVFLFAVAMIVYTGVSVIKTGQFDIINFGLGAAGLLTGGAGAKKLGEPK